MEIRKNRNLAASLLLLIASSPALASVESGRPKDWISHAVEFRDTRAKLPRGESAVQRLEVIELPYSAADVPAGVLLMIPGFFQNSACFDLMPERGVSLARDLMRKHRLKIYFLNVRGLGKSSVGKKLAIDDFAIDDIRAAVAFVAKREKTKIIVFGHSQGGNMLEATYSGITRCSGGGNCFDREVAELRARDVRSLALSGANVAMTVESPDSPLKKLGAIGKRVKPVLAKLMDRIHVRGLVRNPLLAPFAYLKPWEFLYHRANVDRAAMKALYARTLENSWVGVVNQYVDGINNESITTLNPNGPGDSYVAALGNLTLPLVLVTYGLDPMAEPGTTRRDNFAPMASAKKKFYVIPDRGHEDFMMVEKLHADWDGPMAELLKL